MPPITRIQPFSLFNYQKYIREKLRIKKKCQTFVKSKGKPLDFPILNNPNQLIQ